MTILTLLACSKKGTIENKTLQGMCVYDNKNPRHIDGDSYFRHGSLCHTHFNRYPEQGVQRTPLRAKQYNSY